VHEVRSFASITTAPENEVTRHACVLGVVVTQPLQGVLALDPIIERRHADENVDDRLGSQSGNCGRAVMLDAARKIPLGGQYADPFLLELSRPAWVVVHELVHAMLETQHYFP
jgi:hypothetical protein